jgi:hypothetical protein
VFAVEFVLSTRISCLCEDHLLQSVCRRICVIDADLLLWEDHLLQSHQGFRCSFDGCWMPSTRRLLDAVNSGCADDALRNGGSAALPMAVCGHRRRTSEEGCRPSQSKEELHRSNDVTIDLCKLMS